MATQFDTTTACSIYANYADMLDRAPDDVTAERLIDAASYARDVALDAPVCHFGDVRTKLAMILRDTAGEPIEVGNIAFIYRDINALLGLAS